MMLQMSRRRVAAGYVCGSPKGGAFNCCHGCTCGAHCRLQLIKGAALPTRCPLSHLEH